MNGVVVNNKFVMGVWFSPANAYTRICFWPTSSVGANSQKCCYRSTVGQDIATFFITCGVLSNAWEELCCANNLKNFSLNDNEDIAYVSFPLFQEIEHFNDNRRKYGEGNIQTDN